MRIEPFFDSDTSSLTYVVWDEATRDAVVIDPVVEFDPVRVSLATAGVERVDAFLAKGGLILRLVLETHVHADHLSGAKWLQERHHVGIAIGEHVRTVQATFRDLLDLDDLPADGSPFDRLVRHGDVVEAGSLSFRVLHTPGHTPACVTYVCGDAAFVGDAIFLPDYGTGRCDFPGGSAERLYASIREHLFALPDSTRVFVGHDYAPGGRELAWETTIGAEKALNIHVGSGKSREEFVRFRTTRDATLSPPRLMWPSVQFNVRGGALPRPAPNGRSYLKLPVGVFDQKG